ncbi:MAG: GNAT family N-acetyltransferase [Crocinitomicaceae bacterium]|nr:GNAT family N-acetyltransferase [Crocinitomicaceae bacterium]
MTNKSVDHIIPPVPVEILKKELNDERFVRDVNKGENKVFIINHHNSPNVMQEIGRLRELTFTLAGGGTGLEVDIDEKDTAENCYEQLIVWSPEDEVITGGYRFFDCAKSTSPDQHELSTAHYFNFSEKFITNYLPYSIELGRSWVHPDYQPAVNPRKGLFALDNLWDGLGAIVIRHPHMRYFFGKVTMYTNYNEDAKKAVLGFMQYYFPDREKLAWPKKAIYTDVGEHPIIDTLKGLEFKDGLKELQKYCREKNENIPPLINNYMQLSPTMKSFGTAQNPDFGGVEETGILVTVADIYDFKKERHLQGI